MEYIFEKDGRRRKAGRVNCDACGNDFLKRLSWIGERNYCSSKCSSRGSRNRVELTCSYCNTSFDRPPNKLSNSKSGLYFCSRKCKDLAQRVENSIIPLHNYKNGIAIYRKKAFRIFGKKCEGCGYDEYDDLLEVHHIDHDRENNKRSNLIVLCVMCHKAIHKNLAHITNRKFKYSK